MELEFDINITPGVLYDYMLSHMYRTPSGIIGAAVGALMIIAFCMTLKPPYLIVGIVIIAYVPWTLFIKSRQQYLANPAYKKPLHFKMDDDGITVSQRENTTVSQEDGDGTDSSPAVKEDAAGADSSSVSWADVYKAVSSPSSILIYTGKANAFMLPKKDLGDKKTAVIQMISTHVEPSKVKIRGN